MILKSLRPECLTAVLLTLGAFTLPAWCQGENSAQGPSGPGSRSEMDDLRKRAIVQKMAPPSPLDKMLALDQILKEKKPNWKAQYADSQFDVDPDNYKDTDVMIPLVLGVRIADGILAIQAKDAEKLNECAADIESLAKKLNVDEGSLNRAKTARTAANKGEWLRVFSELSRLQDGVLNEIEKKSNKDRGVLLMSGGWMQGLRFAAKVINANYTGPLSNFLREPRLVSMLRENLAKLPGDLHANAKVKEMDEMMGKVREIVNVGLDDSKPDGWVQQEKVKELITMTDAFVKSLTEK